MDLPPPNFTLGDPYSARWNYRELPVDNICATQGAGFLKRLYAAVGVAPMLAWGSELQSALIDKATFLSTQAPSPAWTPVIRALQADLASTRTSRLGHIFGIYVAYYLASNRRLDAISIPPGATLLQWGVPPQDDRGLNDGAVVCIDPARDQPFLSVDATVVQESSTGIRMGEGRALPPDQITQANAGIITLGGLVVIGLLGAGAWWLLGRNERSNPNHGSYAKADRKAQQAKRAAQRGDTTEAERLYDEAARLYAEAEGYQPNSRSNPSYTRAELDAMRACQERCEFRKLAL